MSTEPRVNELILLFFAEAKSEGIKTKWNKLEEAESGASCSAEGISVAGPRRLFPVAKASLPDDSLYFCEAPRIFFQAFQIN